MDHKDKSVSTSLPGMLVLEASSRHVSGLTFLARPHCEEAQTKRAPGEAGDYDAWPAPSSSDSTALSGHHRTVRSTLSQNGPAASTSHFLTHCCCFRSPHFGVICHTAINNWIGPDSQMQKMKTILCYSRHISSIRGDNMRVSVEE